MVRSISSLGFHYSKNVRTQFQRWDRNFTIIGDPSHTADLDLRSISGPPNSTLMMNWPSLCSIKIKRDVGKGVQERTNVLQLCSSTERTCAKAVTRSQFLGFTLVLTHPRWSPRMMSACPSLPALMGFWWYSQTMGLPLGWGKPWALGPEMGGSGTPDTSSWSSTGHRTYKILWLSV